MNPSNSAISMKYEKKKFFFFISCYLKPLTHFIFSHNDIYQDIHFMHILRGINEVAQNEKKNTLVSVFQKDGKFFRAFNLVI